MAHSNECNTIGLHTMANAVNQQELLRNLALINELETAVKLVRLGLGEVQNLNISNNFYFLPLQLLSQGLERLMKSYVCVAVMNKTASYPTSKYIKHELGHSLEVLLNEILSKYYVMDARPVVVQDQRFLTSETSIRELLSILTEFGGYTRYHNLNIVTADPRMSVDPVQRWEKLENKIRDGDPSIRDRLFDWEQHDELYRGIARHIVVLFERLISALSRQLLFGFHGSLGTQFSGILYDFALIYPENWGNTDYRKETTRFREAPRSVHKRTLLDDAMRRFSSSYRSRTIQRAEYKGDWPFHENEVTVECRDARWCFVTIDGYDYALNGKTKGHFKLNDPHEAGAAIIGKSLGDFTKMALDLCDELKREGK